MELTNKTAIVTGGAAGIGRCCCETLASHGAAVLVADIDFDGACKTAESINADGGRAEAYKADMSKVPEIQAMVAYAAQAFGGIDILVNNAGVLHSTPIEDITEAEWDFMNAVNLKAVFFACQAALPWLKKSANGKIVNMGSLAGRNGGIANGLGYSATKSGVIGLTRGLATRLAKYNINANAVCPGTTETAILKSFSEEKKAELKTKIPIGRLGSVEDVAAAVCFLCSDEAKFITGVALDVNGGMYIG